ncbi:MAG TPA: dihydrodipicolinate synthase family protein [Acidimicrobiia bacterium]
MFTCVGVALVTLFDSSGAVDAPATAEHAARLVELGVSALIVAGTTGEPMSLEPEERIALIEAVRGVADGTPVIAGTGAVSTRQAVRLTRDAVDAGADAVLALSPPAPVDVSGYYRAVVAEAGDSPVLAYHFPRISGPGVEPGSLDGFGVVGLKDSSGDPRTMFATLSAFSGAYYPGSAFLVSLAAASGAAGAILAVANIAPEIAVRAFDGDQDAQRELAGVELSLTGNRWAAIKAATAERFGTSAYTRLS